jgi:hypothetical protein
MAAIGATNIVMPAFRNVIVGNTADYSTRVNLDTDTLYGFFVDEGFVTVDETHIFHSSLTAGEQPAFAAATASPGSRLTSTTVPTTNTQALAGFFDSADLVFTSGAVIASGPNVEKLMIGKLITNAAASPLLYHFGTATGLPLTPNGADITVVWNSSGIARH